MRRHGLPGTYTHGCRCAECRAAWRRYNAARARSADMKSGTTLERLGERWTPAEDALVLSEADPSVVAAKTGRTTRSVVTRRWRLTRAAT